MANTLCHPHLFSLQIFFQDSKISLFQILFWFISQKCFQKPLSTWFFILSPITTLKKTAFKNVVGRRKCYLTSVFSFSHNVFDPFRSKFQCLSQVFFVVFNCFEFWHVWIFVVWYNLHSGVLGQGTNLFSRILFLLSHFYNTKSGSILLLFFF